METPMQTTSRPTGIQDPTRARPRGGMRTLLRRRRRTAPPVNGMSPGPADIDMRRRVSGEVAERNILAEARAQASDEQAAKFDAQEQLIAELRRQLDKATVRARYLTVRDLDAALKAAGVENGVGSVNSLGLDGPRGDMDGALEVIVHRYTVDAYGSRSMRHDADHHEGAVIRTERPDGSQGPPIAAETRRFLLRRDGGLDPR
jgi:hypothetical protein